MNKEKFVDKVNGYGVLFRFILPILVTVIAYLGKMAVNGINSKINEVGYKLDKLDNHFVNHLSDHKNIEIKLESRLSTIETQLRLLNGKSQRQDRNKGL